MWVAIANAIVLLVPAVSAERQPLLFHLRTNLAAKIASNVRNGRAAETEDACYSAFGRYSFLMGGTVKENMYTTVTGFTLDECKDACEYGAWKGCVGFSRYADEIATDDYTDQCFWVTNTSAYIRNNPFAAGWEEVLFTKDARGMRNSTHDNLAACCYRGVQSGYCDGNEIECSVNCGRNSVSCTRKVPPGLADL